MDFNDTPDEATFRAQARSWLETNAKPLGDGERRGALAEPEDREAVDRSQAWQKQKADAGWACITWPKEYGGRGATPMQAAIWAQEEQCFEVPPNIFSIGIGMAGPTILAHGTDEQKEKWIPKLITGEEIWCQLFSEPAAGSDLAGLRTTAVRDGEDWLINGQKIWTSGAHWSDWGVIVARHDPSAVKHAGLTYFVVDMHAPGVEVRPITTINGGRIFNEVFFSDVRIPDAYRLDAVGNGWRVAITTLMNERASIGAAGGDAMIDELLALASEPQPDGSRPLDNAAVRQKLADFYVRSKGIENAGKRILTTLSKGGLPGPEASLAKLVAGSLMQELADYAIGLQGQAGVIQSSWTDRYLSIPGIRIAGGTDEVLRNIISERVLGLPPEARADKGLPFKDIPSGPPNA
ncbi:MAG: acyl-CoA dehydrogenase family protein [Deltaproteobacteria bacterium]|nr:acyl-CoA dehydrogenase family protein [Deltaproteobacteria bacterium]